MSDTYHILNGDALAEQFPIGINGVKIVLRECLVDGPVDADNLSDLYNIRSQYLTNTYGDIGINYKSDVEPEFAKILSIPKSASVYLWFERDLFCQVNCWFTCYLLEQHLGDNDVFFVLPTSDLEWGFGGMNSHELESAFINPIPVSGLELIELAKLWEAYQKTDILKMRELTNELSRFEWIQKAVDVVIDLMVNNTPNQILKALIDQFGSDNFEPVFQQFHKQVPIYGYGDLQVKRLFDEIVANQKT